VEDTVELRLCVYNNIHLTVWSGVFLVPAVKATHVSLHWKNLLENWPLMSKV